MSFPSPTLSPPALSLYQLSYQSLAFGGIVRGAIYQLVNVQGLDIPPMNTGDVERPLDQGEFIGIDLSAGRDITITQIVSAATPAALDAARRALAGVFWSQANVEAPLYIQMPSGIYAVMARPRKYNFTLDLNMVQGYGGTATGLLHATDPRVYASPSKSSTIGLPSPGGGFSFPLSFPLSFGAGGSGGIVTVYNNGNVEMRPVFVITGPCLNPGVTDNSLTGVPRIGFTLSVNAGDTLTIDTDFQSAVYRVGGTGTGSSRRSALTPGSTWFNFPPGAHEITFNSSDNTQVAATLAIQSADAYAGL